jgi:sulfane dehydrogenase subunit SoxC
VIAELLADEAPADLLAALGKDPRLVPYGGGNFGTPPELLDGLIVPTERFFVRSNGPIPRLDPAAWRLTVSGHVERPLDLSLADLHALPRRTLTAFLECAGNGRTRFDPVPPGTPWRNDAVGNAGWEGAPLAAVLDRAGVRDGAVDVVCQGADFAGMRRGLPLATARDPDTLLVWAMNGEPLGAAHGGPVRLLVPGWAGIASTKWLIALEVLDRAFDGFWNADNYVFWTAAGEPVRPVREMPVKSVLTEPADGATLRPGPRLVAGYAWSGHGAIRRVEVSTDGGATWTEATLATAGRRSWVRFEHRWQAVPGAARLLARATDERGLTQPAAPEWNAKGYAMNAIHAVTVTVEG